MQAVPVTEASPLMMLLEQTDHLVPKELMTAVDGVVEAIATLTDIAGRLAGEQQPHSMLSGFTNISSESEKQAGHGWGAIEGGA